ncbi:MAG TPA: hypothetical protein VKX46_18925 [Ktedonobacteraceae bacterium]|nr:hypothetical protein [Ktedonobacteraceae bacterium]
MSIDEAVENEQMAVVSMTLPRRVLNIPNAAPVRFQTLDLARHIAIAPNGRRYVVATFDDTRMQRGLVTSIYPQQNGYLTLVRLPVHEFSSEDPDQALQRHIAVIQAIQQGRLKEYVQANQ